MNGKTVYSIGGPCGVGKDTIVSAILERFPDDVYRFPRTTTRKCRSLEREGIEYFFTDKEDFSLKRDRGEIVCVDDAVVASYGIDISFLRHQCFNGCPSRIVLVEGICGVRLKEFIGSVTTIYITAHFEEIIERLRDRGHSEQEFSLRSQWVRRQLEEEPDQFDHVVFNRPQKLEKAIQEVLRIMRLA